MNRRKGIILLGVVVLLSLILYTTIAIIHAQLSNNGLLLHPSNFDLTLIPGQSTTQTITLDNTTNQVMQVQTLLKNFTAKGEQGGVSLTAQDTTFSLANWITVTPQSTTIQPRSAATFTFTINPPMNAEPGGHFGSIVFATVPTANSGGTGAALSEQLASLILAEVPGNVTEQASVVSFNTDQQFYSFGPVTFTARVQNTGNVHIQPAGEVSVTGSFGQHFDVPIKSLNVLPNAIRQIPATLNQHLLFGKYDATFIGVYGSKNEQLTASTEFYAFPIPYGIIAVIILVFLFLTRRRIGKALKAILTGK